MLTMNAVGRPLKVNYKTIAKLTDALQHSATVTDACLYAGISRDTYYRYIKTEPVFAEKMRNAKSDQSRRVTFMTFSY